MDVVAADKTIADQKLKIVMVPISTVPLLKFLLNAFPGKHEWVGEKELVVDALKEEVVNETLRHCRLMVNKIVRGVGV